MMNQSTLFKSLTIVRYESASSYTSHLTMMIYLYRLRRQYKFFLLLPCFESVFSNTYLQQMFNRRPSSKPKLAFWNKSDRSLSDAESSLPSQRRNIWTRKHTELLAIANNPWVLWLKMVNFCVSESADETDFALAGFPPVEERSGPGKYFCPKIGNSWRNKSMYRLRTDLWKRLLGRLRMLLYYYLLRNTKFMSNYKASKWYDWQKPTMIVKACSSLSEIFLVQLGYLRAMPPY